MAAAAPPRRPSWLTRATWPLAGIAFTSFFIFLGFPYELLAMRLDDQVERAFEIQLEIGDLSPHLGLTGPGLAAYDVRAAPRGGRAIVLERLVVRPAWSLAWLQGTPALHLDVTSEIGSGAGTLVFGERGGWDGSLSAVRVGSLPFEMPAALSVEGVLDADVNLHAAGADAGGGLLGQVDFELRDGTLSSEGLPVAVPFDRLYGQLRFGDESFVTLSGVRLEGPMIAGTIDGQVGHGPAGRQPLAIDITYQARDPGMASMLGSVGTRAADGFSRLSVSGTLARPVVR